MSWRDNPSIVWQDGGGRQLKLNGDRRGPRYFAIPYGGDSRYVYAPRGAAEWDELLHRLAVAAGRRIVGIEDAPRPIEVGDTVTAEGRAGAHVVRAIDVDVALLRREIDSLPMVASLNKLRHAEPEPEPEVVWVEQGDTPDDEWTEMLAQALEDGRRVELESADRWLATSSTSSGLRRYRNPALDYRMEAPESTVCTEDHRLCTLGDWCCAEAPDVELVCSRPPGHDGPHVACDPSGHDDERNLASWGGDL